METPLIEMSYGNRQNINCVAKTAFYRAKISIGHTNPQIWDVPPEGPMLFNRIGKKYPNHREAFTGKQIPEADPTWVKVPNPVRPDPGLKDRYITYLEQTYFNGEEQGRAFWSAYHLHHIRPRAYGGTNNWDNLAMIAIPVHAQYTGWFNGF